MNDEKEFAKLQVQKPSQETNIPVIKFRDQKLSPQQIQILEKIGEGYTNNEISKILGITKRNIEYHIQKLRDMISSKVGYRLNDREIVLFANDMLDGFDKYKETHLKEKRNTHTIKILDNWDRDGDLAAYDQSALKQFLNEDYDPTIIPVGFKTFNGQLKAIEIPRKYSFKIEINESNKIAA